MTPPTLAEIMAQRRGQCRAERITVRPAGQASLFRPAPGDLPTATERAAKGARIDLFRTPAGFIPDMFPQPQAKPRKAK